jgi:ABC-2 type transport system ATP-binding protein
MSTLAIETENLTRKYGDFTAVKQLNLKIKPGIVYGFLGPNGCGKTTTLRMMCGVLMPSEGSVKLFGENATPYKDSMRKNIGYMSQRFSLYNELSCYENLRFYAGIYGLDSKRRDERIKELIELTHLSKFRDALVGTLSGGWRQRVALAAAVMHSPKILFLDEPTSGVDPVSGRLFWEIVYTLASNGVTIVVSTHSMNEAEHCDEVAFLSAGRVIREGTPANLRATFPGKMIAITSSDPIALSHKLNEEFDDNLESYIYGNEIRIRTDEESENLFKEYDFKKVEPTLEDLFVYLTEHKDVATS